MKIREPGASFITGILGSFVILSLIVAAGWLVGALNSAAHQNAIWSAYSVMMATGSIVCALGFAFGFAVIHRLDRICIRLEMLLPPRPESFPDLEPRERLSRMLDQKKAA